MKTFKAIFLKLDVKQAKLPEIEQNARASRHYTFNTDNDIEVGDCIQSEDYSATIMCTEVLPEPFKYFNKRNQGLTNEESDYTIPLKVLGTLPTNEDLLYGVFHKVKGFNLNR